MKAYLGIALLLILGWARMAPAQVDAEGTYRLQIDDIVTLTVYNEQQLAAQLRVGRDGNVTAPFIGNVRAVGKTTTELEAVLAAEYTRRLKLRDPKVSIVLSGMRSIQITVIGAVSRPGVISPMRPTDTLLTALSVAGGAVNGAADLQRATLRRGSTRELIPVDLQAMLLYGDMSQNYVVQDNDELIVPEDLRNRILILGMIATPGFYPYREAMTVTDAMSIARGEVPGRTRLSHTVVLRQKPGDPDNYYQIKVDLIKFLNKGDSSQNIRLQPGDIIVFQSTNAPDWERIGSIANSLFIVDRFARDGFFGSRIGR